MLTLDPRLFVSQTGWERDDGFSDAQFLQPSDLIDDFLGVYRTWRARIIENLMMRADIEHFEREENTQ